MNKKIRKSEISQVISGFDFEKVRVHMKETGWRWASAPQMGVPTVTNLKDTARYLLTQVVKSKDAKVKWSRGGFTATKSLDKIELTFKFKKP